MIFSLSKVFNSFVSGSFSFWFLLISIQSCKKDSVESEPLPDDIFYQTDGTFIETVDSFKSPAWDCPDLPVPIDSSVSYGIDMNNDGKSDFIVDVNHTVNYCSHCSWYASYIHVYSTDTSNALAYDGSPFQNAQIMSGLHSIPEWVKGWTHKILLRDLPGCGPFNNLKDFERQQYIGVKVGDNYGYIEVAPKSINGIVVLRYALNRTPGNSIKCGQTK